MSGADSGGTPMEPGTEEWAFETGSWASSVESSPAVADGTVYVGSNDGNLYAVDAASGEKEWTFETGDEVFSSPTVADGTVYVGSRDNHLYAVAAASGEEEWAFETGDSVKSSPTVADGTVYVGSNDGNLYAVAAASGEEEWAFETGDRVRSSPMVVDGTVYVGSRDNHLYAVAAGSGREEWAFEIGRWIDSSPMVVDGTVYVGSRDNHLYAVAAGSGREEWAFETGDWVYSSPTVADGTVYVGSNDGNLYAVAAASGEEEWAFETGDEVFSSPTVADGTVYVGSNDGNLYAVAAASGEEEWAFEIGNWVRSSPTVADGTVYVGSRDNHLYAVAGERATAESTDSVGAPEDVSVGVEWAGITVEKSFEPDDYPVPAIAYTIRSDRDRSADVRIVDSVPDDVPPQNIGFHPEYGAEFWAATDDRIIFERRFEAGEEYTTVYGLRAKATEDIERFLSEPAIESVGGGIGGDEEATGHDEAAGEEGASSDRSSVDEAPTERVPAADSAASPPRRASLSYEALTIVEEIGAGGQAIVTKVRLPAEKQPPATAALREPDTSATLAREAVEEFLQQAETWATIDAREREKQRWDGYEHIVGVVATGDRQPWLALEYMDGGDLEALLAEHPDGLPVDQALWYGECVCKGLEIAHNLGRAHLDVKPGNVLLRETDGWPWPKLADWGLARTLAEETGTMEGLSVQYAGPEQFDSGRFGDPDQLTDIYQTGALVYALLTGAPPATGGQLEVMRTVIGEEPITPPSERRAELPPEVDAAVGLALEREKTDRYSSVSAFGDALNALRTGGRLPPAVAARLDE